MNINIYYKNKNNKFKVDPLESILNIKNRFFSIHNENNEKNNLDNYDIFLDNKKLNNYDYLDKFNISQYSKLNIYSKNKGGNKIPVLYYVIGTIIVLLPIVILSLGFIPAFSSMVGIIIQKSFGKIFDYLECNLGKKTLVNRFKWLTTSIVQYLILGLIIYIIISLPLIILCTMLKGQSIFENPLNLCKPLKTAKTASSLLIIFYFMFYLMFRFGNWAGNILLDICKKNYILKTLSPIVESAINLYNDFKYIPIYFIPFVGLPIMGYIESIELILPLFFVLLTTIKTAGCSKLLDKSKFLNQLKNKMNSDNKICCTKNEMKQSSNQNTITDNDKNSNINQIQIPSSTYLNQNKNTMNGGNKAEDKFITFENQENFNKNRNSLNSNSVLLDKCNEDKKNPCCAKKNMLIIADGLKSVLDFPLANVYIKQKNLYNSFILLIHAFYEEAINENDSNEEIKIGYIPEKKIYLKKVLNENNNSITPKVKNLITKYLYETNRFDDNVNVESIFKMINDDISKSTLGNSKLIESIKQKMEDIDNDAIKYYKELKIEYIKGPSYFKSILKNILMNSTCNIFNTSDTSISIINSMGTIESVIDMFSAGIVSGSFISIIYVLTVIILIIMKIFGLF